MSLLSLRRRMLLDLPMGIGDHDDTNGLTRNRGRAGAAFDGVFGAGAWKPDKLANRSGYYFDNGANLDCSAGYSLESGLLTVACVWDGSYPAAADGIFAWEDGLGNYVCLLYTTATDVRFYVGSGAPGAAAQVPKASWPVEQKKNIFMGVFDGTNTLAYINGKLAATAASPVAPPSNSYPIVVGARVGPANGYWGNIYQVSMSDEAFSPLDAKEYHYHYSRLCGRAREIA